MHSNEEESPGAAAQAYAEKALFAVQALNTSRGYEAGQSKNSVDPIPPPALVDLVSDEEEDHNVK